MKKKNLFETTTVFYAKSFLKIAYTEIVMYVR